MGSTFSRFLEFGVFARDRSGRSAVSTDGDTATCSKERFRMVNKEQVQAAKGMQKCTNRGINMWHAWCEGRKMQESIQEMSSDRMNLLLSRFIQKLQGGMVQKCCTIFTRPPFPLWRVGGGSRFDTKLSCTHCIAVCILSCKSNAALVKEVKEHSKTLDN